MVPEFAILADAPLPAQTFLPNVSSPAANAGPNGGGPSRNLKGVTEYELDIPNGHGLLVQWRHNRMRIPRAVMISLVERALTMMSARDQDSILIVEDTNSYAFGIRRFTGGTEPHLSQMAMILALNTILLYLKGNSLTRGFSGQIRLSFLILAEWKIESLNTISWASLCGGSRSCVVKDEL